jgi:hypothetical protein
MVNVASIEKGIKALQDVETDTSSYTRTTIKRKLYSSNIAQSKRFPLQLLPTEASRGARTTPYATRWMLWQQTQTDTRACSVQVMLLWFTCTDERYADSTTAATRCTTLRTTVPVPTSVPGTHPTIREHATADRNAAIVSIQSGAPDLQPCSRRIFAITLDANEPGNECTDVSAYDWTTNDSACA